MTEEVQSPQLLVRAASEMLESGSTDINWEKVTPQTFNSLAVLLDFATSQIFHWIC